MKGERKAKTISVFGTPNSANSLATPVSVKSRSIQIFPSFDCAWAASDRWRYRDWGNR
jgi:hypothetical protein